MKNSLKILKELYYTKVVSIRLTENSRKQLVNNIKAITKRAQQEIRINMTVDNNNKKSYSSRFVLNEQNLTKLTKYSTIIGKIVALKSLSNLNMRITLSSKNSEPKVFNYIMNLLNFENFKLDSNPGLIIAVEDNCSEFISDFNFDEVEINLTKEKIRSLQGFKVFNFLVAEKPLHCSLLSFKEVFNSMFFDLSNEIMDFEQDLILIAKFLKIPLVEEIVNKETPPIKALASQSESNNKINDKEINIEDNFENACNIFLEESKGNKFCEDQESSASDQTIYLSDKQQKVDRNPILIQEKKEETENLKNIIRNREQKLHNYEAAIDKALKEFEELNLKNRNSNQIAYEIATENLKRDFARLKNSIEFDKTESINNINNDISII